MIRKAAGLIFLVIAVLLSGCIQPSGSGFAYGDGRHNLRGKGDALTLEVGRRVPLQCMAQP